MAQLFISKPKEFNTKAKILSTTWLYIIVVNPGDNENLLGQMDYEKEVSFIPAFKNRSDAEKGIQFFSTKSTNKHEIHAIIYEDLANYALNEKMLIFIIGENGNIEDRITPQIS